MAAVVFVNSSITIVTPPRFCKQFESYKISSIDCLFRSFSFPSLSKTSIFTANRELPSNSMSSLITSPLRVNASSSTGNYIEDLSEGFNNLSPSSATLDDLLIVGPGVLGRLVAQKWREEYPGSQIFGKTMTTDHHDELVKIGVNPSLKGSPLSHKFPFVIFCAPPSRSLDYPGDVREAVLNWNGEGSFLFTSSSALYDCNDGGSCDENSPAVPIGRNPRMDVLLKAENIVLESGGCVLRLAGLYKADRGAHTFWLKKRTVEAGPDHILNLIHYEDAASLSVAILRNKLRSGIFLGCDNYPISRQEIMNLVNRSGKYSETFDGFTGTNDTMGKKLNNSKTREEIGWQPKYPSFPEFLGVSD